MHTAIRSVSLTLVVSAGLIGQPPAPATTLSDTETAIAGFRQISRELNESVKNFYGHLDQTIARLDHGYRPENGRLVSGADVDLIGGPSDVTWSAIRRFASFRMLAARSEKYAPAPVADLDHIQRLILQARNMVDDSNAVLRKLFVVSAVDFDPRNDAVMKARHAQFLKARDGTEDAARRALLTLPLDQAEAASPEETAEKAWSSLGESAASQKPVSEASLQSASLRSAPAIPLRFERRKRVTVINETSCRMAITDSGIEDADGRHIFYQEEWVQRGQSIIRYRWRVGVDTTTGEHLLLKRYAPRELRGVLEELYGQRNRDYLWYLEPPDDSTEPTRDEMESALATVAQAGEAIRAATRDFKAGIRDAVARQDRLHVAANEPLVDGGLPEGMRQNLFAIRGHLAGVGAILESEGRVRKVIAQAETTVQDLEPLAAWSNRPVAAAVWAQLLDRSDRAIDSVRDAETEVLRVLPPDSSRAEDQFPAMEENVIVRIRLTRSKDPLDRSVRVLQEVWRLETSALGLREVRRIVSLILIDPETGKQNRAGEGTRYYKISPGSPLEGVYDEYAADEVRLGSQMEPGP